MDFHAFVEFYLPAYATFLYYNITGSFDIGGVEGSQGVMGMAPGKK